MTPLPKRNFSVPVTEVFSAETRRRGEQTGISRAMTESSSPTGLTKLISSPRLRASVVKLQLFLSLCAATTFSQAQTNVLILDSVVSEVQTNNPSIKSARADWEATKERVPQARAWEDPRVEADVTAGRFVEVMPNSFPDQRFMVEQMLPIAGKNRLRGDAAVAEAMMSFQQYHRRQLEVINMTREAYYMLANEYKQMEVNRKYAGLWKQFKQLARHKYEVGVLTEADVLRAETEFAKLEEARFDIERHISDAQTKLNTLMTRPAQAPLAPPAEMVFKPIELSLDKVVAIALNCRPEILMARAKIEATQARLDAAKREWIPEPSLRVEADRYNNGSQAIDEVSAGLSFNLPWFNRKKYRAGVRENQKMLESAQQELESQRLETIGMVRDQLKSIETYHHHTELFLGNLLPLAEQTATAKKLGYETDKSGFLDFLSAQQEVQDIESMYWDHLAHYLIAEAHLEEMVGANPLSGTEPSSSHAHHHESP